MQSLQRQDPTKLLQKRLHSIDSYFSEEDYYIFLQKVF